MRCVVAASPPANIDWLKESAIISSGGIGDGGDHVGGGGDLVGGGGDHIVGGGGHIGGGGDHISGIGGGIASVVVQFVVLSLWWSNLWYCRCR